MPKKTLIDETIGWVNYIQNTEIKQQPAAIDWQVEYQKKSELYDELKEQYAIEKKRADEAVEREQRIQELLGRILKKTNGHEAYSNEAYIHFWIREVQRSLYGDDCNEGNR
ncbi:hypothetical protein [Paenibacillus alvei]|uniref:Uncharacterized protein n=1 Tax=Paenibacillus alvei TaxID=44250 RepID=A0A383RDH0_PAEAL|nr:hypothetical protein [Paenibacillus alvei]SYX84632.1 protein of unknown function [Paenibacillus alvei]